MISSTGTVEENILLTHGHTMPSENFSHVDKIIMGHIHPVFFQEDSVMNGQRVWVSIKTEKENIFPNKTGEIEMQHTENNTKNQFHQLLVKLKKYQKQKSSH
jgi:metallophosphoesterase superfamily enzyme